MTVIFDRIREETRCRFDHEGALASARIRAIESHERIKEFLGYRGNWRDIVLTVVHAREAWGFFHAPDIEIAAAEAGEIVMMSGGRKDEAIDAVEREITRREFRFSGTDNPCDEIMSSDYRGWVRAA